MKGRTYRYMEQEALYPFGYGLSYTSFVQGQTTADFDEITADGVVTISTTIKNIGAMPGGQTVQVYVKAIRDNTPNAQLKGIRKVYLYPGQEEEVHITLKSSAFALYNEEAEFMVEKGEYAVYVGMQQPDKRSCELTGRKPIQLTVSCKKQISI